MKEGYNGYSNYATWNIMLWIDNCEWSQEHWLDAARELKDEPYASKILAERMKEEFQEDLENYTEDRGPCCFSDLLGHALGTVDWWQCAGCLLSDVEEDVK